ncbi:metallophosphoesterase [Aquimarina sp. ERC-38]|uniref:metallophosphoesterase n=1 Tax=Aquimarina sp. ERC-38 TaxID=2949996 RepID=UPI0022471213|nr:metallophosphoesterase [Aquimarina sp. ERC-38]UZO81092.1 metallophosphoesterase [Aquimarina sp. ERC-38]
MKILVPIILFLFLLGCASYEPKYREVYTPQPENTTKEIEKTFYLIGDAGYAQEGASTPGLLALEKYLKEHKQEGNYTIFLGDNIYPDGMPKKEAKDRSIAEHRLNMQAEAVKNFKGEVIFIPGNHDWYNEGLKGLAREEKYLNKQIKDKNIFKPKNGCALQSIEVSDNIQLIILDSQWYLEDWDKHPTINDNCPEIKTREALFLEIESEFKKNQNKTILFTLHHPLYTYGVHGGKFAMSKHLFPSQRKIPLPGLASLVTLIRTTGGISSQDTQNKQYQKLINRLETLAQGGEKIIFASGHEHSLQYNVKDGVRQIVSGAGAKNSYAALGKYSQFAYGGQGFVRLDIYKDGSSYATYFSSKNNEPDPVFEVEVYPKNREFNTDTIALPPTATVKASVYEKEGTERSKVYEEIWGDHYRELYGTDVEVPVALLDTLYGGLEVVRRGGGHQTRTLRLQDKEGKEYNLRALKKSGVLFLQAVLFKENYVKESLENTVSERILKDFYTAAHPYAFTVVPGLSDAIGLYHTNPRLIYLPKQKKLGKFNEDHGDELYMIEERPEEGHLDLESFGTPDDIESTQDVFERLRKDEKYKVDENEYIKARIFDMLIGDWDRHEDQWRWAEFELENGDHIFKPIPRDRDQAFSNFDGAFLGALKGSMGFAKQFQVYDEEVDDVKWLNISALRLDRNLLQSTTATDWKKQAEFIQKNLSDKAIDKAFERLPEAAKGETAERVKKKLKGRRNHIVSIAMEYYDYVSELGIIWGTDKDDYFEIIRMKNGKTEVIVRRIKDNKPADTVSQRIYDRAVTKELWIYGLDDDDVFEVKGKPDNPIKIRIIGGQNNDVYNIKKGRRVRVYDYKSKPNTVQKKGGARFKFTDNYSINHFNKDQRTSKVNMILPNIGFNPDDGLLFGVTDVFTYKGFYKNPFTQQHSLGIGYYLATSSFDIRYTGKFAGVLNNYNLVVKGVYTNPNFAENFFGFGNGTENNQDELGLDFNRVQMSTYGGTVGFEKTGRFGSYFSYMASVEGIEIQRTPGRFLSESNIFSENSRIFNRQWFGGFNITYRYESYDLLVNPSKGMKFELSAGSKTNLEDTDRTFGYIKPYLGFYNALSRNKRWVLKTAALSQFNITKNYEFFQSAQLGQENLLRGYRRQRFSGQTSLAANADVRYSFGQFKTSLIPLQIGVFVGSGVGRVWQDNTPEDNSWHADVGGGFWLNSTNAISGTLNIFTGQDDVRLSAGFKLQF